MEVTLSRKSAKSRTQGRKLHRTEAKTRIARARKARADLEQELKACRREIAHARERLVEATKQQTATSEMLRLISNSPIQSVLDAVAEHAARLCEASNARIWRLEDNLLRLVASYGESSATMNGREGLPADRDTVTGRAAYDRRTIHVHDLAAESGEYPVGSRLVEGEGWHTTLATPLLREGTPIGVILVRRMEVRPFHDQQITLLETFAAQAEIAIENVRLFEAEKQRALALAHANRDLAEREAKVRRLVDANIIGIFVWEFEERIIEANDAFLRMVGYDREELVAGRLRLTDLRRPDWRDRSERAIEELKMTGTVQPFEKEYARKDGSRVPVLIGAATFEEGGNQGVAFVLDLTERKRAEDALRESEAKVRRLVDANIIGIFVWEFDKQIIEANDAFLRMLGYDREDLVAGRLLLTDLRSPGWRDRKEELKRTGTVQPLETEYCRKDGSRVPVLLGAATLEEGGNQGVAFLLDLTERKRAEEALRESEAKFRDYAETASDWFWETGPDLKFTLLTENAFGSHPALRIGTACWDRALDVETEPEKWRLVWSTLESHKPFRDFVYCTVGGSGAPMYVKASGKPVFDGSGEFRGYRGTGSDVTAIVRAQRAEASLRTVQAELAHVSRVTTLGQLTASIAHEINQPIGSARNNARAALNFLDRSPPDLGEVREALGCIVGDADRAGGIIDRIRDQIRKAPQRYNHFDLNQAIEEVIGLAQSMITEHRVSVQTRLASGMVPVHGDRVQLQQVVLNLILNAVEAMSAVEADGRDLLVSTEQSQANGTLVAVRDCGPGIDPKRLELVFEAFYTTKSGGMGMGLSICRSIIDAHGGRLWATANEPRGVLFQFTLPRAQAKSSNRHAVHETGEPHEDIALDASHPPAFEGSQ
jgi:PAS domain S-box-containing protein